MIDKGLLFDHCCVLIPFNTLTDVCINVLCVPVYVQFMCFQHGLKEMEEKNDNQPQVVSSNPSNFSIA